MSQKINDLKILFIEEHSNSGSHRIFIHNLYEWFKLESIKVNLSCKDDIDDFKNYNIIICGKNIDDILFNKILKERNHKSLLGIVDAHIGKLEFCDFCIVSSNSLWNLALNKNKNVLYFPHIEMPFSKKKIHNYKEIITIGYHGNLEHLNQLSINYKNALENISKIHKIKLHVIYNIKLGEWINNRPKIDITCINWNQNTLEEELLNIDIGIVPNIIEELSTKNTESDIMHSTNIDWILRYKATINNGRILVFNQIGIPVISEMFPSAENTLGNVDCGFIAQTENAVFYSLDKLIRNYKYRQLVANNAHNEFSRLYNYKNWLKKLLNDLNELYLRNINDL